MSLELVEVLLVVVVVVVIVEVVVNVVFEVVVVEEVFVLLVVVMGVACMNSRNKLKRRIAMCFCLSPPSQKLVPAVVV